MSMKGLIAVDNDVALSEILESGQIVLTDRVVEHAFIRNILSFCYQSSAPKCACVVMNFYRALDDNPAYELEKPPYNLYTRLILDMEIPPYILEFIIVVADSGNTDFELMFVLEDIVSKYVNSDVVIYLDRLFQIIIDYTPEDMQIVYDLCIEQSNFAAAEFIANRMRMTTKIIETPPYIIVKDEYVEKTTGQLVKELNLDSINIEDVSSIDDTATAVINIKNNLESLGFDTSANTQSEMQDMLRTLIMTSGPEVSQWMTFASNTPVAADEDSEKLFKVLGPLNAVLQSVSLKIDKNSKCGVYGCRMLTCNCLSEEDFEDENFDFSGDMKFLSDDFTTKWFKGYCTVCNLRITCANDAVRRPNSTGSWLGCFCSFDCVAADKDRPELDIIETNLVRIIKLQLESIGLFKRADDYKNEYILPILTEEDEFDK